MSKKNIREAWRNLDNYFGPSYFGQDSKLRNAAQIYSSLVLKANDEERIKFIGKKHLSKVAVKELDGKQFSKFLSNVIQYERFKVKD